MPEITSSAARSTVTTERSALVADALRSNGRLRLRVHGESMLPSLWPGDVVEIASCSPEDLRSGDVVLAQRNGRLFLHRLVSPISADGFQLRGDSMPGSDPQYPPDALLGRLVHSIDVATDNAKANVDRSRRPVALSRAVGWMLCHCGFARRLALKLHQRQASTHEFQTLGAV
jgi:hypothetical protein